MVRKFGRRSVPAGMKEQLSRMQQDSAQISPPADSLLDSLSTLHARCEEDRSSTYPLHNLFVFGQRQNARRISFSLFHVKNKLVNMRQEGVVFGIATVLIGLVIHKYGTAVLEAPITARKVDSGGLAAAALLTTFLAFVVERTLALLFESNLIRPRLKNLLFPFKEASALILTVQICLYYQIDMMQIVLDDPAPSWLGLLLTAFFVAGGAKGPLRMWEKMGVGNHTEEKEKKTKPKKKEVQRSTTASPSSAQP